MFGQPPRLYRLETTTPRQLRFVCTFVVLAVLTITSQRSGAQQPSSPFRGRVDLVEVEALVLDRHGNFVGDLTREDFAIKEDRSPQTISTFEVIAADQKPRVARKRGDDVYTNQQQTNSTLWLLVLDDLQVHPVDTVPLKRLGAKLVEQLGAQDLMAIGSTSGRHESSQEFTTDRGRLLRAIDSYVPQASIGQPSPGLLAQQERLYVARTVLGILTRAAGQLAGERHRRKALVFLSRGIDWPMNDTSEDVASDIRQMIEAAQRANVVIYPIDPRGLVHQIGADPSQDSLRVFSSETGGIAAVNTNLLDRAIEAMVRENRSYYQLGYVTNRPQDGRFHEIKVSVSRPGLEVRAKRGYVASKPAGDKRAAVSPLDQLVAAPIQASGLQLRVAAAPIPSPSKRGGAIVVAVEADGNTLLNAAGSSDGAARAAEVVVTAIDVNGKSAAIDRVRTALPSTKSPAPDPTWVRIASRLDVARAGHYQVRVGVRAAESDTTGTVFSELDVPEFAKSRLSMSGIVVGLQPDTDGLRSQAARLKGLLPIVPVATRTFRRTDNPALFVRVRAEHESSAVDIKFTIQTVDGGEVWSADRTLTTNGTHFDELVLPLPVAILPPGEYLARIQAALRDGRAAPENGETRFFVQ